MDRQRYKRRDRAALFLAVASLAVLPLVALAAWRIVAREPRVEVQIATRTPQAPRAIVLANDVRTIPLEPRALTPAAQVIDDSLFDTLESDDPHLEAAFDRLMGQLRAAIALRPTLVVWLFDRTHSADVLRQEVMYRLSRDYVRLLTDLRATCGANAPSIACNDTHDEPLLTVVASFGTGVEVLTHEPTADVDAIVAALENVSGRGSHGENVFSAVAELARKYMRYRVDGGYLVRIVVVTDEAGDDRQSVDDAIAASAMASIPVDCIGYTAAWGRVDGPARFAEGEPKPGETRVRQGPESWRPERIALDFPHTIGLDDARLDIDAQFAPYDLARLCLASGGTYFALPMAEAVEQPFTDPRRYAPVYQSDAENQAYVDRRAALRALLTAAALPRIEVLSAPRTTFRATDAAALRRALDAAQKPAARLLPAIDRLCDTLRAGEPDRANLEQRRHQAAFDLAMGRALAAKVRAETFLTLLAALKNGKTFEKPKSTTWVLVPAGTTELSSAHERLAKTARVYLRRVAAEHPGTPWAMMAEAELDVPLAWRWAER